MTEKLIMIARQPDPEELAVIERKGGLRLNNDMRASILKKALDHAFGKRQKEHTSKSAALGHLAMVEAFGADKLRMAAKLGKPWAVPCTDRYGAKQPDGVPVTFRVGMFGKQMSLLVKDALPTYVSDYSYFKVKEEGLVKLIEEHSDAGEKLKTEINKTRHALEALLSKVSTYKSLEATWPEGKKFYKHIPVDYPYRHQVPATLISDLNKSLGL